VRKACVRARKERKRVRRYFAAEEVVQKREPPEQVCGAFDTVASAAHFMRERFAAHAARQLRAPRYSSGFVGMPMVAAPVSVALRYFRFHHATKNARRHSSHDTTVCHAAAECASRRCPLYFIAITIFAAAISPADDATSECAKHARSRRYYVDARHRAACRGRRSARCAR